MTKLADFYETLRERVSESAEEFEPSDRSRERAFTEHILVQMANKDLVDNFTLFDYDKPQYVLHAGGFTEDGSGIYLVASSYIESSKPEKILKADVDALRDRLKRFLAGSLKGFHDKLPNGDARDFALSVATQKEEISQAKLILIFDRVGKDYRYDEEVIDQVQVKTEFWDLERLNTDLVPDKGPEPVHIDLSDYGVEIYLQEGSKVPNLYQSFLTVFPGEFLAKVYADKGSSLLERNVRAFLQLRTDVNKGIYKTVEEEPEMFFTYNNGISGTASRLVIEKTPKGLLLKRIEDFQIVNGGQTTATLHKAKNRELDLSRIKVQVKLTEVLSKDKLDEIVPRISRSSNTQNPVKEADFSANETFHRAIERLSRNTIVPDPTGGKKASYWFYERARGQYDVYKSQAETPATRRAFKEKFPPTQRFDKVMLAKASMTWDSCSPQLVSLGGQKNFSEFTKKLATGDVPKEPDRRYFKELACKVRLFQTMDQIVRETQESGYKANIVTYTLAWMSHAFKGQLPYGQIWKNQEIPQEIKAVMERLGHEVRKHLVATDGTTTANVTEWAKEDKCWEDLKNKVIPIPSSERQKYEHLISIDQGIASEPDLADGGAEQNQEQQIMAISVATWSKLKSWKRLDSKSRMILDLTVRSVKAGRAPRPEFRVASLAIYRHAVAHGFKP